MYFNITGFIPTDAEPDALVVKAVLANMDGSFAEHNKAVHGGQALLQ